MIGALRELEYCRMVQQTQGPHRYKWYVLGDMVPICPKVNYKLQYQPGYTLCPKTKKEILYESVAQQCTEISQMPIAEKKALEEICFCGSKLPSQEDIMYDILADRV